MRAEIFKICRRPYCLAPGTAEARSAMGCVSLCFVLRRLAGLHEKLPYLKRGKDIHIVSPRRCQEKILCLQRKTALQGTLKHTSQGTHELDHAPALGVNGFTPNGLILINV